MNKKENSPRRSSSGDYILVAVMLTALQLTHSLKFGWAWTGGAMLGYVIGDLLVRLFRKVRRK